MTEYKCGSFCTASVNPEELDNMVIPGEYDYVLVRIQARKPQEAKQLTDTGFTFHDRYLRMEINIRKTQEMRCKLAEKAPTFPVRVNSDYDDEMLSLACLAYDCDRRYHLDPLYNMDKASLMIEAQLRMNQGEGCKIVKIYDQAESSLLGFTVLRKAENIVYENVMGVTAPGIKGKVSAFSLYNSMLDTISEWSDGRGKYIGYVSSENAASINLHIGLGAVITKVEDEYIYRKR